MNRYLTVADLVRINDRMVRKWGGFLVSAIKGF
jgi:hypothetical protein